jgi:TorA maturation chaperone TorD
MKNDGIDPAQIQALSRLFAYPQTWPGERDLKRVGMETGVARDRDAKQLEALQSEYVRLFINALPETPCPPYGSFYLEGTLMGISTLEVKDLYAAYGFHTDEMPDHIAVELEFLALLGTASKQEEEVGESLDFLLGRLRSWTPAFFEQVDKNDRVGFFRELSKSAGRLLLR